MKNRPQRPWWDRYSPTRDRSAGSTFRNPAGYSSTGRADDSHDLKAWSLIDAAGLRDLGKPEGFNRRQVEGWAGRWRRFR